jgi:hypothetical protein
VSYRDGVQPCGCRLPRDSEWKAEDELPTFPLLFPVSASHWRPVLSRTPMSKGQRGKGKGNGSPGAIRSPVS